MNKKILFVTYGGGHANIVRFVYPYLLQHTDYRLEILALTVAGNTMKKYSIPFKTLSDYLPLLHNREQILAYGERLAETEYNSASGMSREESVVYLGCGFSDLANEVGEEEAWKKFRAIGRKAFCPTEIMKKILEYEDPDLVVVTCDVRTELASAYAANAMSIPVLQIADYPGIRYKKYECRLAVMNSFVRDLAIRYGGFHEEDVEITGQPVFEDDLTTDPGHLREVKEQIGEYQGRMVLYLEQPLPETAAIEATLIDIAERHPKDVFVFKLHPNQDLPDERTPRRNVMIIRDAEVKYLLHLCDVAITKNSTSGLEATLIGKPLVCLAPDGNESAKRIAEFGVAVYTETLDELEQLVYACMEPDSVLSRRLAEGRQQFYNKENALHNICQCIEQMLEEKAQVSESSNP